jgi:hypothetical protein
VDPIVLAPLLALGVAVGSVAVTVRALRRARRDLDRAASTLVPPAADDRSR